MQGMQPDQVFICAAPEAIALLNFEIDMHLYSFRAYPNNRACNSDLIQLRLQ